MESIENVIDCAKRLLNLNGVCIDNNVFRLHYKVSGILIGSLSMIVLARDLLGDPIDCMFDALPPVPMDYYCLVQSTFTVVSHVNRHVRIGKDVVQPGVGPYVEGEDEVKHQKYYYWVGIALFFQSTLFYTGRYIWKLMEGNRVRMLVNDLNDKISLGGSYDADSKATVVDYWISHLHSHTSYISWFVACELVNLANVIGQMYFMNVFLGNEFTTYGYDVLWMSDVVPSKRFDPMALMFPKVTKCSFYKYGRSGTIENHDGICVLPLNIVNEKIYMFLWAWFVFVAVISVIHFVFRILTLTVPWIRLVILKSKCSMCNKREVDVVFKECHIGDWFILHQLARNIQPLAFKDIITELAAKSQHKQNV